jgi:hypothetical protein
VIQSDHLDIEIFSTGGHGATWDATFANRLPRKLGKFGPRRTKSISWYVADAPITNNQLGKRGGIAGQEMLEVWIHDCGTHRIAGGRHMKGRRVATIVVLLFVLRLPGWPQDQVKGRSVATKPQLQVFFSRLETQWLNAIQNKDPAALNLIVSDDFHLWTSAPPGSPISREEWLLGIFGRRLLSFQMLQLAVREVSSNIVVVSFVQTETYQQSATPQTDEHFVVDIWINSGSGDSWRCTDRYYSEVRGIPLKK